MEGSYDPVFHQSGSSTPMSPNAPSGPASQYKANVNRTKTRKWVEAKTVDYGGDDWGGDYDDEPEEPEPPQPQPQPQPLTRSQGPRSSASFSNSQPPSPAGPRPLQTSGLRAASPVITSSPGLKTPAGAAPLHIQTQQQSTAHPAPVDTGSPWRQAPPSRGGTPGAERPREISPHAVGVPQSATASSVYSAVSEFGQMFDRGASPPVQAQGPFQGQRPRVRSPGPQSPNNPAPTRFAPRKSSLGQHDAPADSPYFPIHADSGRPMGSRPGSRQANESAIMSPNKPWMVEGTVGGPRSASPSGSMRSPTATGKPLPFVRPADIYKKLEDEKEKVRRSIDSGRPSMDSLGLGRGSEKAGSLRTQSPAGTSQNARTSQEQGQVRPDSDVISPGLTRAANVAGEEEGEVDTKGRKGTAPGRDDDDSIAPRGPRTGLPTVAERKSEYGIEGLIASYEARGGTSKGASPADERPLAQTAEVTSVPSSRDAAVAVASPESRLNSRSEAGEDRGQQVHNAPETSDFEMREGAGRKDDSASGHLRSNETKQASEGGGGRVGEEAPNQVQSGEELRRLSTSPKLPELGRLSVFGFDLFSSSTSSDPQNSSSFNNRNPTSSPPPPVPTIPHSHSHTIVSPTSPLSTVIESPSPTSPLSGVQNADGVQQTSQAQGQGQREPLTTDGRAVPGTQLPSSTHTVPQSDGASPSSSTRIQPGQPEHQHRLSHSSSPGSEPNPSQDHSATGDRPQTESSQGPQSGSETVTVLHTGPNTVTSKSESEHQPSVDKALPALPSEASVVTPDPQASQLVISSPIPIVGSEKDSSEGDNNTSLSTDPKLVLHPLLRRESEKINAIPPQVSPISGPQAASSSPAKASQLTPVDDQVLPPPNLPGPLVTDYDSYLPSPLSDNNNNNNTMSSSEFLSNKPADNDVVEPTTSKGQPGQGIVVIDTTDNPTPLHPSIPSVTPPAPPVSRGETYITARESPESPSSNADDASLSKSDTLSAEILRSLSHAAPAETPTGKSTDTADPTSATPGDAARESSFLPDLYDDYWTFAGTGNAAESGTVPDITPITTADAMPAALHVSSDETRPNIPVGKDTVLPETPVGKDIAAPETPVGKGIAGPETPVGKETAGLKSPVREDNPRNTDAQAVTVELHRPVLANRFSWERDGPEAAKVVIKVEPKSLADNTESSMATAAVENTPATPVMSSNDMKSADPFVTEPEAPSSTTMDPAHSRTPTPTAQMAQTAQTAPERLSNEFNISAHPGPLTSNPVMTFREIMEMPTHAERITEFNKARNHFAAADSGLETILEHLAVQHPDVIDASRAGAPASQVFANDPSTAQDAGGLLSPTAQGTAPPSNRHHSHPAGHLGPKTKEFFATAGKASKGLFSTLKAKSKKVTN